MTLFFFDLYQALNDPGVFRGGRHVQQPSFFFATDPSCRMLLRCSGSQHQ